MSTPKTIHAAFLATGHCSFVGKIFDASRRDRIAGHAQLLPTVLTPENIDQMKKEAAQVEVLFTCWGFPHNLLTPDRFPSLKLVLFSGGSVKFFAQPLLQRGVHVVGARRSNAVAVAHFCLGQIILACKGWFRNTQHCRDAAMRHSGKCFAGPGLYGEKIALLGMGAVARELVQMLKPLDLDVIVVDPYLAPAEAAKLGVKLDTMEEAFAAAYVVSNHLPNLPKLKGVFNRPLFASMRSNATFINTGRGAQVNETDLIEIMRERPDLTALLDVTEPEPPVSGSPFYELPNVQLSSHIAGAINDEVHRQGDFVIEEFERYATGKPLLHADSLETLDLLA